MRHIVALAVLLLTSCDTSSAPPQADAAPGSPDASVPQNDAQGAADAAPDAVPAPDARAELCNGIDDDHDGVTDEDFACIAFISTEPCTTRCSATADNGEVVCARDCTWPALDGEMCEIVGGGGHCDPVAQTGCEDCEFGTAACYVYPETDGPSDRGKSHCNIPGTRGVGSHCDSPDDCAPGLGCHGAGTAYTQCWRFCIRGTTCAPGVICGPGDLGYASRWGMCSE